MDNKVHNDNLLLNEPIIYKLYIEDIEIEINKIKSDLVSYITVRNNLSNILTRNKRLIDNRTSTTLTKVLETKSQKTVNAIEYYNLDEVQEKALKLYIERYVNVNRVISNQENKIENLQKKIISETDYTKILRMFNRRILEECFRTKYVFSMGFHLGSFRVTKNLQNKLAPNWGEVVKKKKEILARGGILYKGEDAKRAEELGQEYHGEKYIVYKDPFDIWYEWCRETVALRFLPVINDYSFVPARGNYGSMSVMIAEKAKLTREDMEEYPQYRSKLE